jgi:hypothetical protein
MRVRPAARPAAALISLASAFALAVAHAGGPPRDSRSLATAVSATDGATAFLRPHAVRPESLRWASPPGLEGLHAAWAIGAERSPGPYLLRVRLDERARLAPHSHPDPRITTVLHGTLFVGFGAAFDESALVAIPEGASYLAPAHVTHFAWAKEESVEYQEAGVGPTGTEFGAPR